LERTILFNNDFLAPSLTNPVWSSTSVYKLKGFKISLLKYPGKSLPRVMSNRRGVSGILTWFTYLVLKSPKEEIYSEPAK